MTHELVKYEAACRALAECRAVDEVKNLHDKAAAMQAYGRMAKDKTLEVDAAEIRIRAERRLGEMLTAQKADGGLKPAATLKRGPVVVTDDHGTRAKLADAGISKDLSSRSQKLAAVPEAEFEAEIGEWRERVKAENSRVTSRLEKSGAKHSPAASQSDDMVTGDELLEQMQETQAENEQLQERVSVMLQDDKNIEIDKLLTRINGLEGRLQQAMAQIKASEDTTKYHAQLIHKLRKLLGVEGHKEILAAVKALVEEKAEA